MCCSLFSWIAVGELFYDDAAERGPNVRSVLKHYQGASSVQATLWGEVGGETGRRLSSPKSHNTNKPNQAILTYGGYGSEVDDDPILR